MYTDYLAHSTFQNFLGLGRTKSKEHFWAILSVTQIFEVNMNYI